MNQQTKWTHRLARFVASTRGSAISLGTRQAAARVIADTVGVMLAGRQSDAGQLALAHHRDLAASETPLGRSWVAGSPNGAPSEVAALVNGTLSHALDYDDTFPGAGHPSAPVLSAALAAAPPGELLTGSQLAEGFTVGFEVMVRLSQAIGVAHYYKGWHVTGTIGAFASTAAACRIRNLDEERTRVALGLAGSFASGMQLNFGTTTKPLHGGLAARNGVLAAQLATLGASASGAVLDGSMGFFDLYGQGGSQAELLHQLGAPFALEDPGTSLKKYPCCFIAMRPIDALLGLRRANGLRSEDVAEVVCRVPVKALHAMVYPRATTGLEAKFSIEYILAAALLDGRISLSSFTDDAVRRPEIRTVMERVRTEEDPALRPEDPFAEHSGPANGGRVEVVLNLRDGRSLVASESEAHGGARNPFTWDDIAVKFLDCATWGGYPEYAARYAFDRLMTLERIDDVSEVLRQLSGSLAL